MKNKMPRLGLLFSIVLASNPAFAQTERPHPDFSRLLDGVSSSFGGQTMALPPAPVAPAAAAPAPAPASGGPGQTTLRPETGQVNFAYGAMVDRLERFNRIIIGRDRRGRSRRTVIRTGVTAADRVESGGIQNIILHSTQGRGACGGSVTTLLQSVAAAHFLVCRDGSITRMVAIENIANQTKDGVMNAHSVGIESEAGILPLPYFVHGDWDPALYWKMYASIAILVRAISQETGVVTDREHIKTHEEVDRGRNDAHTDPGPDFDGTFSPANHNAPAVPYQALLDRFPGQGVTPREYLMRLIHDNEPPQIWMMPSAVGTDQVEVKDAAGLGLAHVIIWKLNAQNAVTVKQHEWSADVGMPPDTMIFATPTEPGSYRIIARNLVGSTSGALLMVANPAASFAGGGAPTGGSLTPEPHVGAGHGMDD